MKNKRIAAILTDSYKETEAFKQQHKICLCEDIIKAKKHLWTQGLKQHDEFLKESTATALFDSLYDMDIDQLTIINDGYGHQITELMQEKLKTLAI